MPKALAAPLKLKYLATTSACAMETELIVADFAVVPDDDLCCGMSTLFDTHYRRGNDGLGSEVLEPWGRFQNRRGSRFESFLGGFRMTVLCQPHRRDGPSSEALHKCGSHGRFFELQEFG
jgi:hypothetical protein